MKESIRTEILPAMSAMVCKGGAIPENISTELGMLYGKIMAVIRAQGLQMTGTPFTHYLDHDPQTGFAHLLAGVPVLRTGSIAVEDKMCFFSEIDAIPRN